MAERTFGWIQDSGNFSNLKRILKAMEVGSDFNLHLRRVMVPMYVPERFGRDDLLKELTKNEMSYSLLKGKGSSCQLTVEENMRMFGYDLNEARKIVSKKGRGNAACTGIGQISVEAQKLLPNGKHKPYQGDWSVDSFLRLGVSLGFMIYDYKKDTCSLSKLGKEFADTRDGSEKEKECIGNALLTYPPACRVMELLAVYGHMTKFEIGCRLGFIGEDGFTSIPQNLFVSGYCMEGEDLSIIQNTEGSADKYARMIASWLITVGWVVNVPKNVTEEFAGVPYTMTIGQSYRLTLKGRRILNYIRGNSSIAGTPKIVLSDMLATKPSDKLYLRKRRAVILQSILNSPKSISAIKIELNKYGMVEEDVTILDDINNFTNIGLQVKNIGDKYKITDRIIGLTISKKVESKSTQLVQKDALRQRLQNVDHKYLVLLDLAVDGNKNREFEIETMSLLTQELPYKGVHLGGSSRPDGVFYHDVDGVIVDTKAYGNGYNLPLPQADEMMRYIRENRQRGNINPNYWWKNFANNVCNFSYLFVSSSFIAGYQDRLNYIKRSSNCDGGVISAENLLLFAEEVKSGRLSLNDSFNRIRTNTEVLM